MKTEISNNVPNLDCMETNELWEFWKINRRPGRIQSAALFPDKPKGYVSATNDLSCYASNKATAQKLRLEGNISTAIMYENICDSIYNRLPEWAKW